MTVVALKNRFFSDLENVNIASFGLPTLAEVGKIKIGTKGELKRSKSGKAFRQPEKLDHFVITTNYRDIHTDQLVPDRELMEVIAKETGQDSENLKRLPVMLLFDDPELNFIVRFSCYKGASCWCAGDGKKGYRLKDKSGEREEVECPCQRVLPDYKGNEKCKVFGRLLVLLQHAKRIGGCWVFRTTSWNSVRSIQSSMAFLRQITGGVLAGLPLTLTVNPKTVVTPEGTIQTIYVVNLEFWGDFEELLEHSMKIQKRRMEYKLKSEMLEESLKQKLSSVPLIDFDENEQDISDEFFPENLPSTDLEGVDNKPSHGIPDETPQAPEKEPEKKPKKAKPKNSNQPEPTPETKSEPAPEPAPDKDIETLW